jgi:IclR family transcriptional regulator, acetate operon repressor
MNPSKPYPGTQAVIRAVSLLKAFSDSHREWGLTDLARQVGLNKTTTYRLLKALESEGMVSRRTDSDTYMLGPAMMVLGGRALRANNLRSASRAELEYLARLFGETVTLEILVGRDVQIVDEVTGEHLLSGIQSIGTRWPAHTTSTGKVLLAFLPTAEAAKLLAEPLPAPTAKTITDQQQLLAELAEVRRHGYAVAEETLEAGFIAVGAPIYDYNGRAIAAISVGGPLHRLTTSHLPEVAQQIKIAAARISARLGYEE